MEVPKLITAGRSGAERAVLDWAMARGIPHGGWCPKGRLADDGVLSAKYELQETAEADESQAAAWNVRDSDGVVVLTVGNVVSDSFKSTLKLALEPACKKPLTHVTQTQDLDRPHNTLRNWVERYRSKVVHITGTRASEEPTVAAFVWDTLEKAFFSSSYMPLQSFHIRAAQGWLELGSPKEAHHELDQLELSLRHHADALEMRWHLHAQMKEWPACLDVAKTLFKHHGGMARSWVHRAFALHELKRTEEAYDALLPVVDKFPQAWTIPYNLACYCAQLGRLEEAGKWYDHALGIDAKAVKQAGETDPDLKPLWESRRLI